MAVMEKFLNSFGLLLQNRTDKIVVFSIPTCLKPKSYNQKGKQQKQKKQKTKKKNSMCLDNVLFGLSNS